jgi:hypothetical protein
VRQRILSWARLYWPYALVSLGILLPLLTPGYVLTMDMVFVPHPPIPNEINASFPFYALLHYISYVIPGDVVQKLLLASILLGAGIGMDRLLRTLFTYPQSQWAITAASLFYMTSAFVYERMLMGQWAVVAGYAILPFVLEALLRFLRTPTWKHIWWLVAWTLLLSIMSVHALVPLTFAGLLLVGMNYRQWRKFVYKLAVGFVALLIASSYWLIPTIAGNNTIGAAVRDGMDTQAFATYGGLFSLLRLHGMWAENYGLFLLPQEVAFLPGVWQTLIWIMMITGFIMLWRRHKQTAIFAFMCVAVGCLVALVGLGTFYREPHKIMILTAIGMSILVSVGAHTWLSRLEPTRPSKAIPAGVFACLLPLLLGAGILWGFSGQLSARAYPSEWYALNQYLERAHDDRSAVFLPWHLYQRYSFSPRIVANPAPTFFEDQDIISSTDPEFVGVRPLRTDTVTRKVDQLLKTRPRDITNRFRELNIGYIIFAQEPGYEQYEFLRSSSDLKRVFTSGRLAVYELKEASS